MSRACRRSEVQRCMCFLIFLCVLWTGLPFEQQGLSVAQEL